MSWPLRLKPLSAATNTTRHAHCQRLEQKHFSSPADPRRAKMIPGTVCPKVKQGTKRATTVYFDLISFAAFCLGHAPDTPYVAFFFFPSLTLERLVWNFPISPLSHGWCLA